jgi:protein-tyrosine phosphatase
VLFGWIVARLLDGADAASALASLAQCTADRLPDDLVGERSAYSRVIDGSIASAPRDSISSSGYVVDTLEAALWCVLNAETFSDAVLAAVNLGGDTDTTGTVAGALAGIKWGVDAIPAQWRDAIARRVEIGDLVERFASVSLAPAPISDSYAVLPGKLLAGEYPRTRDIESSRAKIARFRDAGVDAFLDLTQPGELEPYEGLIAEQLGDDARYLRCPIRDRSAPDDATIRTAHRAIDTLLGEGRTVYVHCWGGHGRTGVIVGTWLIERGLATPDETVELLAELRREIDDADHPSPETVQQIAAVRGWKPLSRR